MDEDNLGRFIGSLIRYQDKMSTVQFYYGLSFAAFTAYIGMISILIISDPFDFRILFFSPLILISIVFLFYGLIKRRKARVWLQNALEITQKNEDRNDTSSEE